MHRRSHGHGQDTPRAPPRQHPRSNDTAVGMMNGRGRPRPALLPLLVAVSALLCVVVQAEDGGSGTERLWKWFQNRVGSTTRAPRYHNNLRMHHVKSASLNNATCMDGSTAGFYVTASITSPNWIIHLQAGGSCTTLSDCVARTRGPLGSSRFFDRSITGDFLLSDDPSVNPAFHSWTKVMIPYCSGDVFVGRRSASRHPLGLSMNGHYIVTAVIRQLKEEYGINNSNAKILFGGTSAGGIGVLANVDHVRTLLAPAQVKAYNDGGWFSLFPNFGEHNTHSQRPAFFKMFTTLFHGFWDGFVDESCRQNESQASACLYGEVALRHIEAPMYVMSPRWDTYQLTRLVADGRRIVRLPPKKHKHRKYLAAYGNHSHNALLQVMRVAKNGVYSPACFSHAFLASCSDDSICYFPPSSSFAIQGKTAYHGLAEWYQSDGREGSYLDAEAPRTSCNPSCCSRLCRKCKPHGATTKADLEPSGDNSVETVVAEQRTSSGYIAMKAFQRQLDASSAATAYHDYITASRVAFCVAMVTLLDVLR